MKFSTFHLFHRFPGQSAKEVYDYQIEVVELLEELGFDGVWVAEHHFRDYGLVNNIFTLLANLAGRTEKLRLGTGIVVLPLHNPIHVAEEAAMVDLLSNGRLQLGIGRGYQSVEFESFGLSLSEARDRFDEALSMILELWTGEDVHFQGKFYGSGNPITLQPKPLQTPHPPVHVAAVSPDTVEIYAARGLPILADPAAPFRKIAKAAETWHTTAAAHGVDTSAVELIASRAVYVAPTIEQAKADQARFEASFDRSRIFNAQSAPIDSKTGEVAKGFEYWQDKYLKGGSVGNDFRWEQLEVIGDPERVIAQIQMVQEMGFSNLMCDFGSTRQVPIEDMRKTLRFFASEVMPAFR
ncbi:alkanesulfonate monooxygenase SsuD/methylene tetrahydromethanopterin reductase-like flavin-dependent oxidoreductase (luciferase family) [Actinocorallia herbida]|uniref:Alkanesulfonate monooxygenase SsuD/methylene tetrahydromethanopterin reductase-like flavin-dependent oxidoreductase (Luciferase family) n=1 Tax=Actinocorallia herbida TaxID=58109 RepID=A0A3N1CQB2_9ACTN|nr:LLM class flavin-dependent oxidoreductase [Actinocorallia herbida]ROO83510.1 alkanesulfonate monooxygenase SsuD/methylene tetrahydromethanopterin reductase-like flavin-dependent oxidoreductase (luciferase family) [Actinocorallia herbida]